MKNAVAFAFIVLVLLLISMFLSSEISSAATTSGVTLSTNRTILASGNLPSCTISISGGIVNVTSGAGATIYSGANVDTAFDEAFTYVHTGGAITVDSGTYTATLQNPETGMYGGLYGDVYGGFVMAYCSNVSVNFQSGAVLTIANGVDHPVFCIWYCNNVLISGMTLNGNAANETVSQTTDGVLVYDCNNTVVTHSTIYNCRNYGWSDGANYNDVTVPCGITYCTLYDCYWNGICFDDSRDKGDFAIGNTVYNCSDVGISSWTTNGVLMLANDIYGINGTDGWAGQGTGSHYGIALEEASVNGVVENNQITNCPEIGINLGGDGLGNINELCMNNTVSGSNIGIFSADEGYDTITQNTVSAWGQDGNYAGALIVFNGTNDIISFNNLRCTTAGGDSDIIYAIDLTNSAFCNNTLSIPLVSGCYGVCLDAGCSNDAVDGNMIQAISGIVINPGVTDARVGFNELSACASGILNSGTGTVSLPASTGILVLDCPGVYGCVSPVSGYYYGSASSQVTITLTPESGCYPCLNVDGSNVTLINNQYTLTMMTDHTVYALFTAVSPTFPLSPSPTPKPSPPSRPSPPSTSTNTVPKLSILPVSTPSPSPLPTPTPATSTTPEPTSLNQLQVSHQNLFQEDVFGTTIVLIAIAVAFVFVLQKHEKTKS